MTDNSTTAKPVIDIDALEVWWDENEHGRWCPSCGDLIKAPHNYESTFDGGMPCECRQCGFPDDIEKMANYFDGESDDH